MRSALFREYESRCSRINLESLKLPIRDPPWEPKYVILGKATGVQGLQFLLTMFVSSCR